MYDPEKSLKRERFVSDLNETIGDLYEKVGENPPDGVMKMVDFISDCVNVLAETTQFDNDADNCFDEEKKTLIEKKSYEIRCEVVDMLKSLRKKLEKEFPE